jgi:hypothetical protein
MDQASKVAGGVVMLYIHNDDGRCRKRGMYIESSDDLYNVLCIHSRARSSIARSGTLVGIML